MITSDLSPLFDILLEKWATFLSSIDIVVLTYIINCILKEDTKIFRSTINDIAAGCGSSFPSVFKALEKAGTFEILTIRHDEKKTRVQLGKKMRLEISKRGI